MALDPVAEFGIHTYVGLPITKYCRAKEEIQNLGLEYQKTCLGHTFRPAVEPPSVIVGHYYAPNIESVQQTAKKIQEEVGAKFHRFFINEIEAKLYELENCQPYPTAESRDYVILTFSEGKGLSYFKLSDTFQKLKQIIQQIGGEIQDPIPVSSELYPFPPFPFVLLGSIQPCRSLAEPYSLPIRGNVWMMRSSEKVSSSTGHLSLLSPIKVDPQRLLFFTKDSRPESFHVLDLQNPFFLPAADVDTEAVGVVHQAPAVAEIKQSEIVLHLRTIATVAQRNMDELKQILPCLSLEERDRAAILCDFKKLSEELGDALANMNGLLHPRHVGRRRIERPDVVPPTDTKEYQFDEEFRCEVTALLDAASTYLNGNQHFENLKRDVNALFQGEFRTNHAAVAYLTGINSYIQILHAPSLAQLTACIGRKLAAMTGEGMR